MAGRVPENYNLYPWRNDINWQPDRRPGRVRALPTKDLPWWKEIDGEIEKRIQEWERENHIYLEERITLNSTAMEATKLKILTRVQIYISNGDTGYGYPRSYVSYNGHFNTGVVEPGANTQIRGLLAGDFYPYYCDAEGHSHDNPFQHTGALIVPLERVSLRPTR